MGQVERSPRGCRGASQALADNRCRGVRRTRSGRLLAIIDVRTACWGDGEVSSGRVGRAVGACHRTTVSRFGYRKALGGGVSAACETRSRGRAWPSDPGRHDRGEMSVPRARLSPACQSGRVGRSRDVCVRASGRRIWVPTPQIKHRRGGGCTNFASRTTSQVVPATQFEPGRPEPGWPEGPDRPAPPHAG